MLTSLVIAIVLAIAALLSPSAWAGNRSMIPPGQEQRIREFVEAGLGALELDGPVAIAIAIDRDRIHVSVADQLDGRLTLFHPSVELEDSIGPAMVLACEPGPCTTATRERWQLAIPDLTEARERVADDVWIVEESGARSYGFAVGSPEPRVQWVDRLGAIAAALAGLGLVVVGLARPRAPAAARVRWIELAVFVVLAAVLVIATKTFTAVLPLHEHNSFIARISCALDPRCLDDSAWSATTLNTYSLLLAAVPARSAAFAHLSLALSVVDLALLWGLGRVTMRALGQPRLGAVAGLSAAGVLAIHPVFWRLSGSASFWPWTLAWALGACLAALWASCERLDGRSPWICALGWLVAAVALAMACGGNLVCLTLGVLLVVAPLGWAHSGEGPGDRWRGVAIAVVALASFAVLVAADYHAGVLRAFGEDGVTGERSLREVLIHQVPLLARPSLSTLVWLLPAALAFAWLRRTESATRHPLRVLAPLLATWWLPASYLNVAAGEPVGSGYPVGFINHHWELTFAALWVGLGVAWMVGAIERRWPDAALGPIPAPVAAVAGLGLAALATIPLAREGWRMAMGTRVNERELVAIEAAFPDLPDHDVLVIAPSILEPIPGAGRRGDPIEVQFPLAVYDAAMRASGREPALVVPMDNLPPPRPGDRYLLYLGAALRSFQPQEIEAGLVPDGFERPTLLRLRDAWTLEVVHEFRIRTEQHEAISNRLAADRVPEIELGFYWMHPRE